MMTDIVESSEEFWIRRYKSLQDQLKTKDARIKADKEINRNLANANHDYSMIIERLKKRETINQDTSDGYHTFRELYEHRRVLTKSLFNLDKRNCWKSWLHDDSTMFDEYFIVGIETKNGMATYHYHKDFWEEFNCKEVENAQAWDGHTSTDAINRIEQHFTRETVSRLKAIDE